MLDRLKPPYNNPLRANSIEHWRKEYDAARGEAVAALGLYPRTTAAELALEAAPSPPTEAEPPAPVLEASTQAETSTAEVALAGSGTSVGEAQIERTTTASQLPPSTDHSGALLPDPADRSLEIAQLRAQSAHLEGLGAFIEGTSEKGAQIVGAAGLGVATLGALLRAYDGDLDFVSLVLLSVGLVLVLGAVITGVRRDRSHTRQAKAVEGEARLRGAEADRLEMPSNAGPTFVDGVAVEAPRDTRPEVRAPAALERSVSTLQVRAKEASPATSTVTSKRGTTASGSASVKASPAKSAASPAKRASARATATPASRQTTPPDAPAAESSRPVKKAPRAR